MLKKFVRLTLRILLAPSLLFFFGEMLFWLTFRRSRLLPSPGEVKNILVVVRVNQVGDMVLMSPFLKSLRQSFPNTYVTLIVKPAVLEITANCPYVDEVMVMPVQRPVPFAFLFRQFHTFAFAANFLWRRKYDIAFLPRQGLDMDNATVLAYCSGARRRIGFSEKMHAKNCDHIDGLDALLTDVVSKGIELHESERPLELLRSLGLSPTLGIPEVFPGEKERKSADDITRTLPRPLVALGLRAANPPIKQWPTPKFSELARRLVTQTECHILLLGGPETIAMGDEISQELGDRVANLCGKTSVNELTAVLAKCALYIGNDSGPTHIAAATGIPTVALFGASCPHKYSPRGRAVNVIWNELPCSPCNRLSHAGACTECIQETQVCMETIDVGTVYTAAIGLMRST